jgi:hypothetical protein
MSLTVAISTHPGYSNLLPYAIKSAEKFADEVLVYSDDEGTGYCVEARKSAIRDAGCDYLVHLDADDWLIAPPGQSGDIWFSDMYLCNSNGDITGTYDYTSLPHTVEEAVEYLRSTVGLLYARAPITSKCSFRVEWLRENDLTWYQWDTTTFGEDVRTMVEYLKHDPVIVYEPGSPFYVYRQHPTQDTTNMYRRSLFAKELDEYVLNELDFPRNG